METTDDSPSTEDKLPTNEATTEPPLFTFQSDLSDDDAPDPLTLDEIAKVSLAALDSALGTPLKYEKELWKSVTRDEQPNGATELPIVEKPRKGVRPVDIEVCLPWLAPAQRAEYRKVSVEDYWPEELEYLRPGKRPRGVSHVFRAILTTCCVVFMGVLHAGAQDMGLQASARGGWAIQDLGLRALDFHNGRARQGPQQLVILSGFFKMDLWARFCYIWRSGLARHGAWSRGSISSGTGIWNAIACASPEPV